MKKVKAQKNISLLLLFDNIVGNDSHCESEFFCTANGILFSSIPSKLLYLELRDHHNCLMKGHMRVTGANGSGLVQGKGGDRQSCPGLSGSAWACPPISSIWVEKIEWGVRTRERRRRIARARTSTRSRTRTRTRRRRRAARARTSTKRRTRTRRRRWTAAYLAKLIRSMPRLSCRSPLHCALHFSTPALNFQSTFKGKEKIPCTHLCCTVHCVLHFSIPAASF